MATARAMVLVRLTALLWLLTDTAMACTPVAARKGTRLLLQCNVCQPPPSTGTRWYNITGDTREEITTGIQPESGALLLTESVQDSAFQFGGQEYECRCGQGPSECNIIYVPPQVSIQVNPPDATVGSEVNITCRADLGFPPVSEMDLYHIHGGATLLNGVPHTIRTVTVLDSGEYTCSMSIGPLQESSSTYLNVYYKPSIQHTTNHTVSVNPLAEQPSTESATLECTIFNNKSQVVMKWFKNGKEIQIDGIKYVQPPLVSETSTSYAGFLIVRRLTESDLGSYECKLFTNYSHMAVEDVQTLYIHPAATAVPPTEDPVSTDVYVTIIVVMSVTISVLVPAVLILGVVAVVLCCHTGRTGSCDICGSGCPTADVKGQVWRVQNLEEIGGCELHKNQPSLVIVPSNPSSPSGASVHVKTSSTHNHSAVPHPTGTCGTNSGSSGCSPQVPAPSSRARKHSRRWSEMIAGEQGEVLLSEGDDDAFHDQ